MSRIRPIRVAVVAVFAAVVTSAAAPKRPPAAPERPPSAATGNPLLAKWKGPYGGVPPFDKVKVADFKPALEAAMDENLKEVGAIAHDPKKPDFENTIAALERAGQTLDRVSAIYNVYRGTMSSDDFQKVEAEMAPRLAAFKDTIIQNKDLFARVAAVYEARPTSNLTPEQQRLVWYEYTTLVRAGARLEGASMQRPA